MWKTEPGAVAGFAAFAYGLPEALLVVDVNGAVKDLNPPAERLLGAAREALRGRSLRSLVSSEPEDLASYLRVCSTNRQLVLGSFQLAGEPPIELRSEGALLEPRSGERPALVALRLRERSSSARHFSLLTEKIDQLATEILRRKRLATVLQGERTALEKIARDAELGECLMPIVETVESLSVYKARAAIFLVDDEVGRLTSGVAPHLGKAFLEAVEATPLGPAAGSAGTAAFTGRTVEVEDTSTDPRWRSLREIALEHGVRACCSTPIETLEGGVLGTFALHYEDARPADPGDLEVVAGLARAAAIAIEGARKRAERKRLLERERRAREAAERADRAKNEFLALISHELRNPLNAMVGWTRLLRTDALEPPQFARAIETIERNVNLQTQLIGDLLDFSRITAGKFSVDRHPTDLVPVVRSSVESLRPVAEAKTLHLVDRQDAAALPVNGDAERLQQVVSNLIQNAIKFTPAGGSVTVSCGRKRDHAEICVADTGRGIPNEFLPHVFDRFRQADSSRSRTQGGLGLGLTVVRNVVELHGGSVEARSEGEGRGAEFVVRIPLSDATTEGADEDNRSLPRLDGVSVLVVDDEADALSFLQTSLHLSGADVVAAASAAEAFERLGERLPDIVVSDIAMPEVDGYAFMAELRAKDGPAWRRLRTIAVTAYAQDRDRAEALRAGYDAHLAKPVEPDRLVRTIARLARAQRLEKR